MNATIHEILKKYWGHSSFRPGQEAIIQSVLKNRDTLALLPTGGGKSICFQVPAMVNDGLCLVVSPLIALMNDQVQNLKKKGIKAMAITSAMSWNEIRVAFGMCINENYKFLYLSPERLQTDIFLKNIHDLNIGMIAVDESHCISQWGYDFRPSYLKIARVRELLPKVPIIALTASATNQVIEDIQQKLIFKNAAVFKSSFERKNLHYIVQQEEDKINRLLSICKKINGTGVVYVRNRKKTVEISYLLNQNEFTADYYHAGLTADERHHKQHNWISGKTRIIVATNAFGMGIDKPDVRFVVHLDLPDSLEAYFQEAGRGGRDGKVAYAVLLFQQNDARQLLENTEKSFPPIDEIKQTYQAIANYYQIAIGSGFGLSVDFDLEAICANYHLNALSVFNSIRFLEKENYLSYQDHSYEPSKLMLLMNKNDLYNFEIKYPKFERIIKSLLRNYGGLFDHYVFINEYQLAKKLMIGKDEVDEQLKRLHKMDVLEYIPKSQLPKLIFTYNRIDAKQLEFKPENYRMLKEIALKRAHSVIKYVNENNSCRNRQLLIYFDEKNVYDCGNCDVCLERKKSDRSSVLNDLNTQIVNMILQKPLSIQDLISVFYRYDKSVVIDLINQLIEQHVLEINESKMLFCRK
jgi:ATP-dependent DNA helicase RecQ